MNIIVKNYFWTCACDTIYLAYSEVYDGETPLYFNLREEELYEVLDDLGVNNDEITLIRVYPDGTEVLWS